jgi:Ca-activated chloride channel homolog
MSITYPYILLTPLFFLALALYQNLSSKAERYSLAVAITPFLRPPPPSMIQRLRKPSLICLKWVAIVCLSIAAAKPVKLSEYVPEQERVNIMLCLDISLSMEGRDFIHGNQTINRLEAVQLVVSDFIAARENDRLGLTVFGKSAFLQSPLTVDHTLLREMLLDLTPGSAGNATAVGDGLGLAIKRIKDLPASSKAIILLTDGANNAGSISPLEAAKLAAKLKIKIHTVGVGSVQAGEYDEETLSRIAKITGGIFFNAETTEKLKEVYLQIDELEKVKSSDKKVLIANELFWSFALVGTISLLLSLIINNFLFPILPWA